jgi:hypothetical protein
VGPSRAVATVVPAGSVVVWSMHTRHAASLWDTTLAPAGQRAVVSFGYGNMDEPWHGGPGFYLKDGGELSHGP